MKKNHLLKLIIFVAIVIFAVLAYQLLGLHNYLSLQYLKEQQGYLQQQFTSNPLKTLVLFALAYVGVTALSLPGAALLTLAAGGLFGLWYGVLVVSFASTIGATLAFLASRYLLKESVRQIAGPRLEAFQKGLEKDGAFYLLSVRLVPVFPFFLVNIVMGLTNIRALTYFWVSQLGMLPGTFVYINAGTQLGQLESLSGIVSPELFGSFVLLAIFPWVAKILLEALSRQRHLRRFKKPQQFDYNLVVIGAGSAGLVSAYIAAAVKSKVALIEKHKMGGDCLNTGCVPSKALIKSAKVRYQLSRAGEFGVLVDQTDVKVNFRQVMSRIQKVIQDIEPHDSIERYTSLGVECFAGSARVLSPYEVQFSAPNGSTQILTTKNIAIASGARPFVPDIPGLKQSNHYTSDNLWELSELPNRLVVLGGGPIGCELAQSFQRLGSQVTLIERGSWLLGREDVEASQIVQEQFRHEGITLLLNHEVVGVKDGSLAQVKVLGNQPSTSVVAFDAIIVALGRKPNVSGFGLEDLGIDLTPYGTIAVDPFLRTLKYANIYACGDVAGPYQLTHAASHQAWFVAVNALFSPFKKYPVDYRVIPWCTFTDPEVARVGLNELEAKVQNIPYQVFTYHLDDLDRAIADGETSGFVKVLTVPGSDRILGVTFVGDHAGDLIAEFVAAMKHGIGLNKVLGTIHIYPTYAEANKFAAGVWKRATAPQWALQILARFHRFRR